MPGARGRPKSLWWSHFQTVEGRIVSACHVLSLPSICPGDFRVVKCLHCDQIVRRGKVGCAAKETSNSGMAHHMRSKHLLVQLIEEQVKAAAGGNNNERDAVQGEAQEEEEEAGSSSILNNMRKRICRSRERNMEVAILRNF